MVICRESKEVVDPPAALQGHDAGGHPRGIGPECERHEIGHRFHLRRKIVQLDNVAVDLVQMRAWRLGSVMTLNRKFDFAHGVQIGGDDLLVRPAGSLQAAAQHVRAEPGEFGRGEGAHHRNGGVRFWLQCAPAGGAAAAAANPDAHFYLGSFYAQLGEYEKARQSFEEALELNPDHKGTIDAMAMYTNSPDQKTLSEQILGMSSKRAPNGPAQKLTTIRQRLVEGNYTDALRLCEEGQKNFPSHNGFLQLTGETQLAMGNVEAAKSAFQRSIKLNAKDKSSHSSLANLYFDLGKYVYAALSFSDVIYLDPDDSDSRYMQGLSYFKAKEWGRAAAAWEDLLHYKPDNEVVRVLLPQTYYILAIEYNRLGNPSMGKQSFKNALSVNPNSNQWLASSMSTLGGYYREKRMYRESLAAYQEVIELAPSDAEAYLGIGLTYWNMDEKDLAISSWQKSLLIKPENNESQGWLILSKQES